jgi:hypothetical protein
MRDSAYATKLWLDGCLPREIGALIGLTEEAINASIWHFVYDDAPCSEVSFSSGDRRAYATFALDRFRQRYGRIPTDFECLAVPATTTAAQRIQGDHVQAEASFGFGLHELTPSPSPPASGTDRQALLLVSSDRITAIEAKLDRVLSLLERGATP